METGHTNFMDSCLQTSLTSSSGVLTVGAVAEPCADLLIELAEQKRVALEREFGGFFFFGKGVLATGN